MKQFSVDDFLLGCFLGWGVTLVVCLALMPERHVFEVEAVKAKVAHWEVDETGHTTFTWNLKERNVNENSKTSE